MNISDLITKIPTELLGESDITLLYRDDEVSTLPVDYRWIVGDFVFRYGNTEGNVLFEPIPLTNFLPEYTSAEEWLDESGYSSMRLITLLDLEQKLGMASMASPKMQAVRAWINGILAAFITNPAPRADWPAPPHSFEETTTEAFSLMV